MHTGSGEGWGFTIFGGAVEYGRVYYGLEKWKEVPKEFRQALTIYIYIYTYF